MRQQSSPFGWIWSLTPSSDHLVSQTSLQRTWLALDGMDLSPLELCAFYNIYAHYERGALANKRTQGLCRKILTEVGENADSGALCLQYDHERASV